MKVVKLNWSRNLLLGAFLLALSCSHAAAQTPAARPAALQTVNIPARITSAVDDTNRVKLRGNVHPLARVEFDRGVAPAELPMQRMLLVLKRSSEQQTALSQLMADQYNTASPSFHQWLMPEQFGQQFGPADTDIQAVTSWLQAHGFEVAKASKGKNTIEFSGTAAQVKEAFRTEIHKYVINGEEHWANVSDPQIPAALEPVVHGIASLHNFRPKPMHHVAGAFTKARDTGKVEAVRPEFETPGGNFGIGPADFAKIYNVPAAFDGTGQSIAIVGVSNINLQDITDFRTVFGLPTGGTNTPIVIIDGSDPGILNDASGSETEALTDVEWSGAVAKGAQIHFVIAADTDSSSGLLLAAIHVLDTNSDPVMSLSFGNCEHDLGTSGNQLFNSLWEQAAAQGITVTVSTGDDGSAGCEDQNAAAPNPATTGLQVSGFASTPFNVAVGGTDFNDSGAQSTYFSATNDPTTLLSAKGYIPESTWNDSCTNAFFGGAAEANCNSSTAANKAAVFTVGGSGGASHCTTVTGGVCSGGYAKPAYQSFITLAHGMPADGHRDLPDVSLFASDGFNKSFYIVCEADDKSVTPATSCKGTSFKFLGIGGTSVSTPSFAGIMALVNQKTGQRQGNANFVLYKLAQQQFTLGTACTSQVLPASPPAATCTFNDVITGTIAMPCTKGSTDCTTSNSGDTIGVLNGFSAAPGPGYDLATGLGSVNATNLVNNWATGQAAFTATTTTLGIAPSTGLVAGQAPFPTVNITVAPTAGPGTPTGDVALVSNAASGQGVDGFTLSGGAVTGQTTNQLTGGTYTVTADYSGDGTFAPSHSTPVSVTVIKASSTAVASVFSSSGGGNFTPFTSGPGPVTLFLSAVVNPSGVLLPTGTVNFVDTFNGTTTTVATAVKLDQSGEAFTASGIASFATGAHSVVAQYGGDNSFTASSSPAVTFTINASTTTPTTTTVTPSVTTVASGGSVMLTAKVTTASNGAGPTGTVQFMNGSSALGTAATCTPTAGSGSTTAFCTATLTTALSILAPPAEPRQVPRWPLAPMWITALALLLAFLLSLKRLPLAKRRGYVYAGLLLFACLAVGIAGCSGTKGGSTGVTPHTDSITAVYSGDTNFSTSTSTAVSISIH